MMHNSGMNILMVSSESVPFSKSGGLADVVGALTPVLSQKGHDARIFVPSYNTKPKDSGDLVCTLEIPMLAGLHKVEIRQKYVGKTPYLFVCAECFNERKGIYGDTSFEPYTDNLGRFSLFSKAALYYCKKMNWQADIIHCHDWTSGLLPYFMKEMNDPFFMNTKTVFTIHNLAYQGTFAKMDFMFVKVKPNEKLFSGTQVNLMQSGIAFSDFITTVSPTYAKEIQTSEQGCGLENLLISRSSRLKGIVNGIDTEEWNPMKDKLIDTHFTADDLSGKAILKAQIQKEFNLPQDPDVPLFAMISRLASQKGFDALAENLDSILDNNKVQFIIIGTGDKRLENLLLEKAEKHANLSVNILFSNKAAHLVEAGSDFFLMPSKYEPCGLNQLYSLRYGTIPIARRTGGLADTIRDLNSDSEQGTGLLFDELSGNEIEKQVAKAIEIYSKPDFNQVRKRAMQQDFSWDSSCEEYIKVYEGLVDFTKVALKQISV